MKTIRTNKKRGFLFWLGRIFLALLALIVLLISTALAAGANNKRDFAEDYPPIGQMVDVGGYRLHLYCTGEAQPGEPTVIVEAGSGSVGLMWASPQESG